MRNDRGYQTDHFLVQQEGGVRLRDAGINRRFSPELHGDHAPVYMCYGMEKITGREMARHARRRGSLLLRRPCVRFYVCDKPFRPSIGLIRALALSAQ